MVKNHRNGGGASPMWPASDCGTLWRRLPRLLVPVRGSGRSHLHPCPPLLAISALTVTIRLSPWLLLRAMPPVQNSLQRRRGIAPPSVSVSTYNTLPDASASLHPHTAHPESGGPAKQRHPPPAPPQVEAPSLPMLPGCPICTTSTCAGTSQTHQTRRMKCATSLPPALRPTQ